MSLTPYLPQDRLQALATNKSLPNRMNGCALFADISGFTPLTEGLRRALGPRQGPEALARQLDAIYTVLIDQIERYGGSVIGFAGDAITCWFDEASGGGSKEEARRAVAAALSMQDAMTPFTAVPLPDGTRTSLSLKVAVAKGPARRFTVGDPKIGLLDVIAGDTVARASTAEQLAQPGDVLLDEATVQALGSGLSVKEWRTDYGGRERFAVVQDHSFEIETFVPAPPPELPDEKLQTWLQRAVAARLLTGPGGFLAEFRPCTALFMRFSGIDYDSEVADTELDGLVRLMQALTDEAGGVLLDLIIGDKGNYAHISFGALSAHEDDARRAVLTARKLLKAAASLGYLAPLQVGITKGVLLVGAYGGQTRRTFGAMGDDVNLAARLMQIAGPGEILVSGQIHTAVAEYFFFEPRPPLPIKGKSDPLPVFAVTNRRHIRAIRLQEPHYALPMVGREQELSTITEKLHLARHGQSQVIGIVSEAGLGKSRLVAEVIRTARGHGFAGYGGACQSDGVNTPYLTWKPVWSAFFDVDPDATLRRQIRWLTSEVEDRAPHRLQVLPLLGILLNIPIPENEFTTPLKPEGRRRALYALLEDCLKAAAQEEPILIVIEDLHWIDALSHDLLEELALALSRFPVCFVLAYRPPKLLRLQEPRLEALPQFTRIELGELGRSECEIAIRAKLAQLYPAQDGTLPEELLDRLMQRAQGNPFYLEELLNFLHDRGLDPREPHVLNKIELPDSLHKLILSRIDRLTPREQTTLRAASIVGRLFWAVWLAGYYPELGRLPEVKPVLDELDALDITPLDSPEPDLAYLFKHIVTHEVAYESLPYATRARLHEQLGLYLETAYPDSPPIEALAFHFGRSDNVEKKRHYLLQAGQIAQENFANQAALVYYDQVLPLLKNPAEKITVLMQRGAVLELMGTWDAAEAEYQDALALANQHMDAEAISNAKFSLGKLYRLRGEYDQANTWLDQVVAVRTERADKAGLVQALTELGSVLLRQGAYDQALETLTEALEQAREAGDGTGVAFALKELGTLAIFQGDYITARKRYEEGLVVLRGLGDKWGISALLNNLGVVAYYLGDFVTSWDIHEESLALRREMGDKAGISMSLNNLGLVVKGDHIRARTLYEESLALRREIGDKRGVADTLNNLSGPALAMGDFAATRSLNEESLSLQQEMGDKRGEGISLTNIGIAAYYLGDYHTARELNEESLALFQELENKSGTASALFGMGLVALAQDSPEARRYMLDSLRLRQEIGEQVQIISSLIGMAGLALHTGDPRRSAQLLGAVDAALNLLEFPMEPEVLYFHRQILADVYGAMDEDSFQTAWKAGNNLTLEEAIAFALQEN